MIGIINNRQAKHSRRRQSERGQSLLELALTMPVLLTIVAGVLEVGNLLVTYNRVQLAAREASRFGAAGGSGQFVPEIVFQASTDSLDTSPDRMSVYVIRPTVEYVSGAFQWDSWTEDCVYGDDCSGSGLDPNHILTEVTQINTGRVSGSDSADVQELAGDRVTIVAVYYEAQTILNLNFWDTGADSNGRVPLRAYTIIRQEIDQEVIGQQEAGCSAFPIAINSNLFSGLVEGDQFTATNNGELGPYDGFEFLAWYVGTGQSEASLVNALTFPGTSSDYVEPDDPTDTQLHRDDRVAVSGVTGASASVANALSNLIDPNIYDSDPGYTLRVIVYSDSTPPGYIGSPSVMAYTISNFAVVQVRAVSGSDLNNITFAFKRFDTSCGYDINVGP